MRTLKIALLTPFLFVFSLFIMAQNAEVNNNLDGENQTTSSKAEVQEIIESFVEDFRNDRFASEKRTVGIEVPNFGSWTLEVTGKKNNDKWEVLLKEGLPNIPAYVYRIESKTLKALDEGIINALTAQGKSFSSDYTPMSVREIEGFKPNEADDGKLNAFSFHFWTKGFPEVIPFNANTTRKAHGSNFTIFYYEKGLRTAWYRVLPNEKVRNDPREQANPFPMLIVAIEGTTEGVVDGKRITLEKGNTVYIPAGATHKWWNETEEPSEAILIMFGEGA